MSSIKKKYLLILVFVCAVCVLNGQIELIDVKLSKEYIANHGIKTWRFYDTGEIKSITFEDNSTTLYNPNGTIQRHSFRSKEWEVKLLSPSESDRLGYTSISGVPIAQEVLPPRDIYVYDEIDNLIKIIRLCPSKIHGDSTMLKVGSKEPINMHKPLNDITSGTSYYKTTAHLDTINIYGGLSGIGIDKDEFFISDLSLTNVNISVELFNLSEKDFDFIFIEKSESITTSIEDYTIHSGVSEVIEFSVALSEGAKEYLVTIVSDSIEIPIQIKYAF